MTDIVDLRSAALSRLRAAGASPKFVSTQTMFSMVRAVADLTAGSAANSIFGHTKTQSQMSDLHAFDAAIGDPGTIAGFGPNTTLTARHTDLRMRRRLNDNASGLVLGFRLVAQPIKTPVSNSSANTCADDSDNTQYIAPDPDGYVRDFTAKAFATDYMPYVQKIGDQKEYLGPIYWQATESGILYCEYFHPEGWEWPNAGKGSELIFGFERVHQTYTKAWAADTDRPWEDIYTGLAVAPTGSAGAAAAALAVLDITVESAVGFGGSITG